MCNLAGKVFIDARRGRRGGSNKGVVITKSNYHGNAGIRISISEDSVKMLGQGVERVIPAIHPDFKNRLYIYDASQVDGCIGFKLTKAGSRRCFRVEAMGKNAFLLNIVGSYSFERDKHNDVYIALNTRN